MDYGATVNVLPRRSTPGVQLQPTQKNCAGGTKALSTLLVQSCFTLEPTT